MPTVELDDDGAPTITLPEGDTPTEVQIATLKKGDGAGRGPPATPCSCSTRRVSGQTARSSTRAGSKQPFSFTDGTGVVAGLQAGARTARPSGSQVLVVLPPQFGYGDGEINEAT